MQLCLPFSSKTEHAYGCPHVHVMQQLQCACEGTAHHWLQHIPASPVVPDHGIHESPNASVDQCSETWDTGNSPQNPVVIESKGSMSCLVYVRAYRAP